MFNYLFFLNALFLNHQRWFDFDASKNASKLSQRSCLENDAFSDASFL